MYPGQRYGFDTYALEHTFAAYPELTSGSTDNVMDYGSGFHLHKYQWDLIHNPERHLGWFDEDEEGESNTTQLIKSISFENNIPIYHIENPQWEFMQKSESVCYVKNHPVVIRVILNLPENDPIPLSVKAIIGESEYINTIEVNQSETPIFMTFNVTAFTSVGFFPEFPIEWHVSYDNITWSILLVSIHCIYVLLNDPVYDQSQVDETQHGLFEPLLYFSCRSSEGATSENEVLEKIWNRFASMELRISEFIPNITVDKLLTYYNQPFPNNDNRFSILRDMPLLSNYGDGECGAFRDLFSASVRYQGIATEWIGVFSRVEDEHFLVKNWVFNNELLVQLDYPYLNYQYKQASKVEVVESQLETVDENGEPTTVYNTQYFLT